MTLADILMAIAGHGLEPTTRPVSDKPLDRRSWRVVLRELDDGMLGTLALEAARTGVLAVSEEQRGDLERLAQAATARCRVANQWLIEAVTTLDRHGIDSCVFRGAATSALDYAQTADRPYRSVHLLVAPPHFSAAAAALTEPGRLVEPADQPRPGRRRALRLAAADGTEVVVHRTLAIGTFGDSIESTDLFASRIWFAVDDTKCSALGTEARLLAACLRARLDQAPPHLLALRDVVQLVLRDDLSLRKVERLAVAWRVEAVVADAVRRAWDALAVSDVVPISAWSRAYQPDRRAQRRLAAYRVPETTCGHEPGLEVGMVHDPARRLRSTAP